MRARRWWVPALCVLAAGAAGARGGAEWGGSCPPGQRQQLRLHAGAATRFEGMVAETTRKFYDATGQTWKQADAETYGTSDFDLDGPYGLFGLACEAQGQFVGFRLVTSFFQASTRTVARRDDYLGVGDDIEYGGRRYDHLMIPAGTPFEADLTGNMTELDLRLLDKYFPHRDETDIFSLIDGEADPVAQLAEAYLKRNEAIAWRLENTED